MTINRIGRYYDKLYQSIRHEERSELIKNRRAKRGIVGLSPEEYGNEGAEDDPSKNRELELSIISDSVKRRREREGYHSARRHDEDDIRSSRSSRKVKKNIGTSPPPQNRENKKRDSKSGGLPYNQLF